MSRAIRDGRGDNRWGTHNQIREAGGQVRKGEKGTQVLFLGIIYLTMRQPSYSSLIRALFPGWGELEKRLRHVLRRGVDRRQGEI